MIIINNYVKIKNMKLRLISIVFIYLILSNCAMAIRIGLNEDINKTYVGSSQNAEFLDANTGNLLFVSRSFFPYSI